MAEKLTPQQRQAVENRGGKLLVSAAAGSGKTKVLVDRLMSYLTDPVSPASIDEFLIITYTKAAAAELRGKIAAKLTQRMAQEPENRHLQRQFQRLYLTQISTVHSFCSVVLKEFAYLPGIPIDFRVADENECAELRLQAMEKVLEAAYECAADNPDFCAFLDSQGLGRDDRQVPELVLKVFDSARCHLQPDAWLAHCLSCTEAKDATDVLQTTYGAYLGQRLFSWLDMQLAALEECCRQAAARDGMTKVVANLSDTVCQLRMLRESSTWDEIIRRKGIDFGTLRFPKNADEALVARIKAVRDACKRGLGKQTRYFADTSAMQLADLASSAAAVRGLTGLVKDFEKTYDRLKTGRRILDFGDLEHRTLDLLLGKNRSGPTSAAHEIGSRFREVMVDEYQDSNAVQDAIYSALTAKRQNLFLVGDVKQSIYQFRLADPGIFLQKYETYVDAAVAKPLEGRKVLLSRNFRSGGAVLAAVNAVFENCMSPRVGGMYYGEEEALHEGIPHDPLPVPEVQLHCVDVREDTYREEAAYVAEKIAGMLKNGALVRHGEAFRPVKAEDIVILLRSPGSAGGYYQRALEERGIRCACGGGEDLLQTPEISTLHCLLQVIGCPLLDIPLVAVLASPVFGFTADELAQLRAESRFTSFYDAVLAHNSEKCQAFAALFSKLRKAARTQPLTVLLEAVFSLTHMDNIYGAMENGRVRKENLHTFYQLAASFESGGNSDLGRFLEHLQTLSQKGLLTAGEQGSSDCVTVMSIHKSKGLEFPLVFLCGLSREFNMESQRSVILSHKEMGIGMNAVDHEKRLRYPTVAKGAIATAIGAESLSEELRVLYVAMTRARDMLIMTYASNRLEKELQEMVLRLDMGCRDLLISEAACPGEWVLLTALSRIEAGELFAMAGKPENTRLQEPCWGIYAVSAPVDNSCVSQDCSMSAEETVSLADLQAVTGFRYAHTAATATPSKQTATQLKGRAKDEEAAQNAPPRKAGFGWREASFRAPQQRGKEYGNAMHAAMQYIDYGACGDIAGVEAELQRLVERSFLSAQQRELVNAEKIAAFFQTELGRRLRCADNVVREFKFSILEDASVYDPACAGEQILLQGVVDCALIEADGITLLDFKTDFVTGETLPIAVERYTPQVNAYASALERIYKSRVKQKLLYFFHMDGFVTL